MYIHSYRHQPQIRARGYQNINITLKNEQGQNIIIRAMVCYDAASQLGMSNFLGN